MIKINEKELNEVQKLSKVRTISIEEVIECLKEYEESLGIAKKNLVGTEIVDCDINAQSFPSAYRYTPESTHFSAIYTSKGWKVTGFERRKVNAPTKKIISKLSETAKIALINKYETYA